MRHERSTYHICLHVERCLQLYDIHACRHVALHEPRQVSCKLCLNYAISGARSSVTIWDGEAWMLGGAVAFFAVHHMRHERPTCHGPRRPGEGMTASTHQALTEARFVGPGVCCFVQACGRSNCVGVNQKSFEGACNVSGNVTAHGDPGGPTRVTAQKA